MNLDDLCSEAGNELRKKFKELAEDMELKYEKWLIEMRRKKYCSDNQYKN